MAAEVSIGWNNDKLLAGSKQAEAIVERSSRQMQTSIDKASKGGGAFRGIGQASLQLQDVAVQLQGGAKATTVIAQQVPQLLGAFGAGGAIVGGLVAVGAGLYNMADAAEIAFTKAKAESDGFQASLKGVLATASASELTTYFTQIQADVSAAYKEIENLGSLSGVLSSYTTALMGGPTPLDRENLANDLAIQKANAAAVIEARLLQLGQQNLDITNLRTAGKNAEADELQRQIDLSAKLFQIQQTQFTAETKAALSNQAIAASSAAAQAIATSKAFSDTQKLIDAQNKLEDLKRTAALESASIYDREKLLKQEITSEEQKQAILRADFVPDQLAIVSSEERLLRLKQDLQRTQSRIADEAWRAAEAQDAVRAAAQAEATAKININGPAAAAGDTSTKARVSANQSRGLSDFYNQGPSRFQQPQQGMSKFEQSQQGQSAYQRLQFQAAQDRAGGPIMPAPAANTAPTTADSRPVVQAIQALPDALASRLLA